MRTDRGRGIWPNDFQRAQNIKAVEAFLDGLTANSIERMPFARDIVLKSPLDPEHPSIGKEAAFKFLVERVFPKIPVCKATIERHIVEDECVATLWTATFMLPGNREVAVRVGAGRAAARLAGWK